MLQTQRSAENKQTSSRCPYARRAQTVIQSCLAGKGTTFSDPTLPSRACLMTCHHIKAAICSHPVMYGGCWLLSDGWVSREQWERRNELLPSSLTAAAHIIFYSTWERSDHSLYHWDVPKLNSKRYSTHMTKLSSCTKRVWGSTPDLVTAGIYTQVVTPSSPERQVHSFWPETGRDSSMTCHSKGPGNVPVHTVHPWLKN